MPESLPEREPVTLRKDLFDRVNMVIEFAKIQEATGVSIESIIDTSVEGFLSGISEGMKEGEI